MANQGVYVGKMERFELVGSNLTEWLAGETLSSVTVETDGKAILTGQPIISSESANFELTGVTKGGCKVHITYLSSTGRGGCLNIVVNVLPCKYSF